MYNLPKPDVTTTYGVNVNVPYGASKETVRRNPDVTKLHYNIREYKPGDTVYDSIVRITPESKYNDVLFFLNLEMMLVGSDTPKYKKLKSLWEDVNNKKLAKKELDLSDECFKNMFNE